MKRLSRREQILIGGCVLVLLVVGLPLLWDTIAVRAPSAAASATKLRAARRERRKHSDALARLEQELALVAERRPPAVLPARVMQRLDRRARVEGIQFREVRPLPVKPLDGMMGVPLQLSFTAPYPRAARFLAGLRADPDGLAVERVVIAATSSDTDLVSVQARLSAFSLTTREKETARG